MPAVATFAVPCRDAGPHLRPLLESLLAQTRPDFLLLLVDDGSTDGSAELARAVAGDRLEVVRNERPRGIGGNWNRCVELVRTPFFCLAHQDDVYRPDFLAASLAALESRPHAGAAHCRARAIDERGDAVAAPAERFKDHFWKHAGRGLAPDDASPASRALQYAHLWRGNFVCCPSVVYRTDAVRAAGPFREDLRFALDWEYWFRLLRAGFAFAGVDRVLVDYRRHDRGASRAATKDLVRFEEELAVLAAAKEQGVAAGLLRASAPPSPALRNNLLHEAFADLQAGACDAAAAKLAFAREKAPAVYGHPYVRVFRALAGLGAPGRALLGLCRAAAVRFGLGGAHG